MLEKQIDKIGGMGSLLKESKKLNNYMFSIDDNLKKIEKNINENNKIISKNFEEIDKKLQALLGHSNITLAK